MRGESCRPAQAGRRWMHFQRRLLFLVGSRVRLVCSCQRNELAGAGALLQQRANLFVKLPKKLIFIKLLDFREFVSSPFLEKIYQRSDSSPLACPVVGGT